MHNGDSLSLGVNLQYFFSSPLLSYLLLISEFSFLHSSFKRWRLVFWNSIHLEVASDSFCFLLYSSWLLVFILYVFELFFSFINLYCLKGLHFSQNNFLIFIFFIPYLIFSFHFWFRDLLRELDKKYEVLLIYLFLQFRNLLKVVHKKLSPFHFLRDITFSFSYCYKSRSCLGAIRL